MMTSALALWLSPICRGMVQAKQPMMMLRVLALRGLAVSAAEPGPDQHAALRRRIITQSTAPASLVGTQGKPVKIMVGSEVPRARWR